MPSPTLLLRTVLTGVIPFLATVSSQSVPGATLFTGNGAPGAGSYQLIDDYESSVFFNKFNFYSSYDPTYGHVQYVTKQVAVQNGYATVSTNNTAVISVDTTNKWPNGGPGRPAVRLISDNTYTHGLFILDLKHMPFGCGTWPAYWLLGPNWPSNGEIDIIEGVNTIGSNSVSMHTSDNCTISGSGQTAGFSTSNCYEAVNGNSGCGSLMSNTATPNNYGDDLNSVGGGVYITEWTSEFVKTWFFPRNAIPASVTSGHPDTSAFGIPAVNAQGSCTIDQHFANMSIIINTDFCGAWAGEVYKYSYPNCPQNASAPSSLDSCVDFVGNNPSQFVDAYWEINSIKVYQMPPGAQPSSTYSTSLSSVMASSSTNTIQRGMGQSTSSISSTSYQGPLSSITTTASVASATPFICPSSNNSIWTDTASQQYTIACGSDYNGGAGSLGVFGANSFEACLEICDNLNGCRAVAYVGGNGAGTCYPKETAGSFVYNGATNGALRVDGPVSLASEVAASSSLSSSSTLYYPTTNTLPSTSSFIMASSTSSPAGSFTTSSPSTPSTSSASCVDNTLVTDDNGVAYTLHCDSNLSGAGGGNFASQTFTDGDFTQCYDYCDMTSGCGAWLWSPGSTTGGFCYLRNLPQTAESGPVGDVVAIMRSSEPTSSFIGIETGSTISSGSSHNVPSDTQSSASSVTSPASTPSCPQINNSKLSESGGRNYTIYCAMDTSGGSFASTIFGDGDFTQCMTGCDNTITCTSWTWSAYTGPGSTGGVCYYKTGSQSSAPGSENEVGGILALSTTTIRTSVASTTTHYSSRASTNSIVSNSVVSHTVLSPSTSSGFWNSGSNSPSSIFSTGPASSSTVSDTAKASSASSTGTESTTSVVVAPACPSSTSVICSQSRTQTICSSSGGEAYNVTCGIINNGNIIDTSGGSKRKRAAEPDFQSCQSLCDTNYACVALNYVDEVCTIFSSVLSTSYSQGAVGALRLPPNYSYTSLSSMPGAAMSSTTTSVGSSTASPLCPGSAGKPYSDASGAVYNLGCYTDFAGNTIGDPITEPSFVDCLPYCDAMSSCVGVQYDFALSLCYLKSSFTGTQTSDTSVIYGRKANPPPNGPGSATVTVTPTTSISLASGATITVVPTITVVSTLPPGGSFTSEPSGSFYVFTTSSSAVGSVGATNVGSASLCYTCALTPTLVTGDPGGPSAPPVTSCPSLSPRPGTGTVTVFTTQTITSCGLPLTCPAPGFVLGGGPNQASQTGQTIVTTTDSRGDPVTYTEIPTAVTGNRPPNGVGASVVTTTDSNGHLTTLTISGKGGVVYTTTDQNGQIITLTRTNSGTPTTVIATGTTSGDISTVMPTCPFSNGELYSDNVGSVYSIECGVRYSNGILETQTLGTFASCFAACDMYNTLTFFLSSQCLGVNFYFESNTNNCELVSGFTPMHAPNVWAGRLTNPHYAPGNNGTNGNGPGGYGTMTTAGPALTTFVVGGSTIVSTIAGGTGPGTGPGSGPGTEVGTGIGGVGGPGTYVIGGSTYYSTFATVGISTIAEVSTYVSNGQTILSTYGYTTGPGPTQYGTATLVSGGSTFVQTSYVPSTVYGVSTAVSTYVSNGITLVSTYGVTTAISVSYVPASTETVTTTTVSISIQTATVSGPTVTASGAPVTITEGGGQQITVTAPPSVIVSYVYPSSSKTSFTCRTYATNYLNGMHGKKIKRSFLDGERVMDERDSMPRPGARP